MSSIEQEAIAGPAVAETAGKWTIMGIMGIGLFMATLDSSIVNIACFWRSASLFMFLAMACWNGSLLPISSLLPASCSPWAGWWISWGRNSCGCWDSSFLP